MSIEDSTKNAIIDSVSLKLSRGFMIDVWVNVKFDCGNQGFGGYCLFNTSRQEDGDFAGRYIAKLFEVVDVERWEDLTHKPIRIVHTNSKISKIGHIYKDIWLDPALLFRDNKETTK